MVGDVDVVQLNHHGSTTTSNQVVPGGGQGRSRGRADRRDQHVRPSEPRDRQQVPEHPGHQRQHASPARACRPPSAAGPVFYQNEASPRGRRSRHAAGLHRRRTRATPGRAPSCCRPTARRPTRSSSFDDGGVRIDAGAPHVSGRRRIGGPHHRLPADGRGRRPAPVLPLATDTVTVTATVNDRESPISSVTLTYCCQRHRAVAGRDDARGRHLSGDDSRAAGRRRASTTRSPADGRRRRRRRSASGYFSGITPIASLRALNAKGEPLYAGYAARIQGTVTASGFSAGTNDDYVQDATGAINVYRSTDTPTVFTPTTPGQSVEVLGRIGFNGGRLRLDITESVEKTSSPYGITILSPAPAPTPVTTTIAALSSNPESFEGQFVSIANVSIVERHDPGDAAAARHVRDHHATAPASFSLKIDDDTDIEGFTPAATVHRGRHRPAGRFPAAVRRRLQPHAAQPRRPRRRRARAGAAAHDRRGARRRGQQRRRHDRAPTSFPIG